MKQNTSLYHRWETWIDTYIKKIEQPGFEIPADDEYKEAQNEGLESYPEK